MKIAVAGAGAAGMLFSVVAARSGHHVTLFDSNEKCGKKLYITGKGRCNLTNLADSETFFRNVVSNPKFLYAAIRGFSPEDTVAFFEELGLKLKTERGNRVFPVSDHSSDVIRALERGMREAGVQVRLNEAVRELSVVDGVAKGVVTEKRAESFDAVVLATGGCSYPATGSTGDGYRFARDAGHTLVPPVPALAELRTETAIARDRSAIRLQNLPSLEGLSLKNVSLRATAGAKTLREEFGEMLFTARGVSGPIALTISSYCNRFDSGALSLVLDFKPALNAEQLDKRILREIESAPNRSFKNLLSTLLPSKAIPFLIELAGIEPERSSNRITKEDRAAIGALLKNTTFQNVSLAGFSSAVVTSGGVSVKEIDPKTMRSKLVRNLYLIGEILDVDALTGGFNLQIAFSTAYAAATHLREE